MKHEEMNKGVQILLERMQSNPEEFIPDWRGNYPPKWRSKLVAIGNRANHIHATKKDPDYYIELPFLSDMEILALWNAMQNLLANRFTEEVMSTLLQDAEVRLVDEELSSSFNQVRNGGTVTLSKVSAPSSYTITASQLKWLETLDPYEKQHAYELLKEYAEQKPVTYKTKARQVFK